MSKPIVFISYSHKDEGWKDHLVTQLRVLELEEHFEVWDDRKIAAGSDWLPEIETALNGAAAAILLVSAEFLTSDFIRRQEVPRLLQRRQTEGVLVVPLILRPCAWRKVEWLAKIQARPIDGQALTTMEKHQAETSLADLAEEVAELLQTPQADLELKPAMPKGEFPGAPVFHVPFARNPFFTGREDVLEDLHRRLNSEGCAALAQVQAISGLGGIGKTQTALEYAYRHRDAYQAVLWARAESEESLTSDFAEMAGVLDLALKGAQEQSLAATSVTAWLGRHSNWLLILDNADRPELLKGFIPIDHQGHVLVTSRAGVFDSLGIAQPLRMEQMPPDEAQRFLCERTGRPKTEGQEAQAVQDLAEELGCLPLALEQAASYIARVGCSFQTYVESFRTRGVKLLERLEPIARDYPESIRTTWVMNIEQVAQQSQASVELLRLSAFLAPDEIPLELVARGAQAIGPSFAAQVSEQDCLSIEEVLHFLSQFSLIQRAPGSDFYSVHRMVQAAVRAAMDEEEQRQWASRTVMAVNQAFQEVEFHEWEFCESLASHAQSCLELVETFGLETTEAGMLLNQLGVYLWDRGRYRPSQPALERALEIRKDLLGHQHLDVAQSLNNLAQLYKAQGDYKRALPLHESALEIRQKLLGPDHPDLALSLNNLAGLYETLGRYDDALPLYRRSLQIREKSLGSKHPDVAQSLNNLAYLFKSKGDYRHALPLYKRALAIQEESFGSDHPEVAQTLNNLAQLYVARGEYQLALPLLERALAIWEKSQGPEHPDVAQALNNLAFLSKSKGDHDRALQLYERSLAIWEKSLGPKHPNVASSLNNLAKLHLDQGDYERATPLLKRTLAIDEATLDPKHPHLAASLSNLALAYLLQADYSRALPLYERALAILEKAKPGHPDLAKALENYASLLEKMGRKDEAKKLKARARRIRAKHARKNRKTTA